VSWASTTAKLLIDFTSPGAELSNLQP